MGDPIYGGSLSEVEIIAKGHSQAYYEHKKAGHRYFSHQEVQDMIAERPSLWPNIGVSLVSFFLKKDVGIAVSLTEINISAREEEYNQGFVQMAKAYRYEKDGIFIEYSSSVSQHYCTEIINFYSAKTGKLLGTSRVHYGI